MTRYEYEYPKVEFKKFTLKLTFENKNDLNLFCKLLQQSENLDQTVHQNAIDFISIYHDLKQTYDIL